MLFYGQFASVMLEFKKQGGGGQDAWKQKSLYTGGTLGGRLWKRIYRKEQWKI